MEEKPTENPLDIPQGREREEHIREQDGVHREGGRRGRRTRKRGPALENVVTLALKGGEEVQITGFGKFYVQERTVREGRNPQTGKKMNIPAQRVPSFSAGNTLKESV